MYRELGFRLILASSSPRRKELLEKSGFPFEIQVADIVEQRQSDEEVLNYILRNCREKALAVSKYYGPLDVILGADTVVLTPSLQLMEKPQDYNDAYRMLSILSDSTHHVYTSYVLYCRNKELKKRCLRTDVTFRKLAAWEIEQYIETGEPWDKSGAYGIQGMAQSFVTRIRGSYTNVMGLPLSHVVQDLNRIDQKFSKQKK